MVQTEEAGAIIDAPSDAEILQQQDDLQADIASESPIVASLAPIEALKKREYRSNALRKLKQLESEYEGMYCIRGDGNCFFRSFLVGMFTCFVQNPRLSERLDSLRKFIHESKGLLMQIGMPEFAIEDFYEEFESQLANLKTNTQTVEDVLELFNQASISDYLVMYARFLTSWYLQMNSELYIPYLQDCSSMQQFVRSEVEPMGKEADHIHCMALTRCLDIPIRIEYLDNSDGPISHLLFPEDGCEPLLYLLYRPGHYDVLQRKRR